MKTTLHFLKHGFTFFCLLIFNNISAQCFVKISSGYQHSIALKEDGTLWGWGYNFYGQLGNGTTDPTAVPIKIGTSNDWVAISTGWYFSAAIKSDGTLWMWGDNQFGVLADGTNGIFNQQNTPVQVGTATNWKSVSAGSGHVLALKTDGTLWAWGYNGQGQLGIGDGSSNNFRDIPVQVESENNWKSIHAGLNFSLAIKNDGTLWSWGENSKGQLGIGVDLGVDVSPRISPLRVGTETDWRYAVAGDHVLALKTDGSLWVWGNNGVGELGDGTTTNKSAPIKIGTSTWKTISAGVIHSLGVKMDGTLWAWGYNYNYQLGDGTRNDYNEPMQVGTATNFESVSAGGQEYSIAIDANGSRWGAGVNSRGQLGDGTGTTKRYFNETICESLLDTKEISAIENVKIFPIPFNENIKINGLGIVNSIELFDIFGKMVLERKNINTENYTLQTNEIIAGVYVLVINSQSGIKKIKVIK